MCGNFGVIAKKAGSFNQNDLCHFRICQVIIELRTSVDIFVPAVRLRLGGIEMTQRGRCSWERDS